jgi:predicted small lipoprotein YifL
MRSAVILLVGCLTLTGCGLTAPRSIPESTGTAPAAAQQDTSTRGSAPAKGQPNPYDSPLAGELLVAFATQYINWNSRTIVTDMRTLATESVGQAHAAMELAAGQTARDYELRRGGIANSGKVEAVAPLTSSGSRWVIVTLERTTAANSSSYQGLAPAWHVIVCAVVRLAPGHWKVSVWQPVS